MKNLFLRMTMIVALMAMGFSAFAQSTVTGTVKDAAGEPVIGAAVQVQGTQNGAIVDIDGTFTLPGVRPGDVLVFSCIGYANQVITWNRGPVNVILQEDTEMLEGTVVTALGIKRATKALGYAVTEIKSEDLNPNLINPVSALQGKVAGVEINGSDGGMFGRNKILIRGASTLGKNNQPIFVVDGIILDNDVVDPSADWDADNLDYGNQLKNLNPDDFETVSVLKGAAATALYGSRGLNGAIIITTKSGRGSRGLGLSFTQTLGFDKVTSGPTFQNVFMEGYPSGYAHYFDAASQWDAHRGNIWADGKEGEVYSLLKIYRDIAGFGMSFGNRFDAQPYLEWVDGSTIPSKAKENNFVDAFNVGFNTNTNVTLSGGNEKSSIYASLSEKYSTGTLPNNSFNRFNALLKATHKLNNAIEVEGSVTFTNSDARNAQPNIGQYFDAASQWDIHRGNVWMEGREGEVYSLKRMFSDIGAWGLSFGNRFDAQPYLEWVDGSVIPSKAKENNFVDAFNVGFNTNTNVTLSGGNEKSSIYASLSEKYSTGTLPNNSFNRFNALLKATHKLNNAIEVEGSVTFTNSDARNAQPNIGQYFIGEGNEPFDRTYDAKYFRDKYKGEHGGIADTSYGDKWGSIPGRSVWWSIWENNTSQKETVVRPNLKVTVQFAPWLKWVTDGSFNYYYTRQETKRPDYHYANSGNSGYYGLSNSTQEQTNLNTNFIFDYKINEDWQIGGFLRGEYYNNYREATAAWTDGGLVVPNRYFLDNSRNPIKGSGSVSGTKRMLSIVGQATASFRDQLFLELTGRNDWSSALVYADKHGNYSYFYPSFSASWLLHETFDLPKSISFFKLRGSIAQVGNDTDPYIINTAYSISNFLHDSETGTNYMNIPGSVYDQNLKPERKTSWELGVDYRMFNNRIGVDATFYKENTRDQIMSVTLPGASGVSSAFINAGNIQNMGIEIALNTIPVEVKDFSWDLNFTFTKNWSKIVELSDLVANYIALQGNADYGNYRIGSVAKVGGTYGILMSDAAPLKDYTYDDQGNITGGSGLPVLYNWQTNYGTTLYRRSGKVEEVGNSVPDFLGSLNTGIRFKRVTLRASFDARFGGYVASYPSHYGTAYGYLATSLEGADAQHGGVTYTSRWDGITYDDGIIPEGIFPKGTKIPQPEGEPYTVGDGQFGTGETFAEVYAKDKVDPCHASSFTYFTNSWSNFVLKDNWFRKLNYIAFRDVSVSWAIPDKWANAIKCQGITLQANAHNLGYILNSMPNKENPESVRGTAASEFRIRNLQGVTTYFTFTINARF